MRQNGIIRWSRSLEQRSYPARHNWSTLELWLSPVDGTFADWMRVNREQRDADHAKTGGFAGARVRVAANGGKIGFSWLTARAELASTGIPNPEGASARHAHRPFGLSS